MNRPIVSKLSDPAASHKRKPSSRRTWLVAWCLVGLGVASPALAQSQFAGVYFNELAGPTENANFAMLVENDGLAEVLFFSYTDVTGANIPGVVIQPNGSFSFATPNGYTVDGTIAGGTVTGTFCCSDTGDINGQLSANTGPLEDSGGFYEGTASGTFNDEGTSGTFSGDTYAIVDAVGDGFVYIDVDAFVGQFFAARFQTAGPITVASNGSISGTLPDGTMISGTLNMNQLTASGSVSFSEPGFTISGTWSVSRTTALPPELASDPIDVTDIADTSSDAMPDIAYLKDTPGADTVDYYSGADGSLIRSRSFLDVNHDLLAISTLRDSNSDGAMGDPAIAALGFRSSDGSYRAQVRRVDDGTRLGSNIRFHDDAAWMAIDIAVLNDTNGDGVSNDPSLAVLAINTSTQVGRVEIRRFSPGNPEHGSLAKRLNFFFDPDWWPVAVEALTLGNTGAVSVLAVNQANDRNRVQTKRVGDGDPVPNINVLGSVWEGRDLAILLDANGDVIANDPAILVLGVNRLSGRNRVQAKLFSDRSLLKNINLVNENSEGLRLAGSSDMNNNLFEEVVGLTARRGSGNVVIKIRDYDTEAVILNINP